jgi:hypothetical protein
VLCLAVAEAAGQIAAQDPARGLPVVGWLGGSGLAARHVALCRAAQLLAGLLALGVWPAGPPLAACFFCVAHASYATFNNHYYLYALLAAEVSLAGPGWALPPPLRRLPGEAPLPLLRLQLAAVYFFAGLGKLKPDWLSGRQLYYVLFPHVEQLTPGLAALLAVGALLLDLAVPLLLILPRGASARPALLALLAAFHLGNAAIFNLGLGAAFGAAHLRGIGSFPFVMLAALPLFAPRILAPGAARVARAAAALRTAAGREPEPERTKLADKPEPERTSAGGAGWLRRGLLALLLASQLLLPVRPYLAAGHPLRPEQQQWSAASELFAWRLKAGLKLCGALELRAVNPVRLPEHGGPLNLTLALFDNYRGGRPGSRAWFLLPGLAIDDPGLLAACRKAAPLAAYARRAREQLAALPEELIGPPAALRVVALSDVAMDLRLAQPHADGRADLAAPGLDLAAAVAPYDSSAGATPSLAALQAAARELAARPTPGMALVQGLSRGSWWVEAVVARALWVARPAARPRLRALHERYRSTCLRIAALAQICPARDPAGPRPALADALRCAATVGANPHHAGPIPAAVEDECSLDPIAVSLGARLAAAPPGEADLGEQRRLFLQSLAPGEGLLDSEPSGHDDGVAQTSAAADGAGGDASCEAGAGTLLPLPVDAVPLAALLAGRGEGVPRVGWAAAAGHVPALLALGRPFVLEDAGGDPAALDAIRRAFDPAELARVLPAARPQAWLTEHPRQWAFKAAGDGDDAARGSARQERLRFGELAEEVAHASTSGGGGTTGVSARSNMANFAAMGLEPWRTATLDHLYGPGGPLALAETEPAVPAGSAAGQPGAGVGGPIWRWSSKGLRWAAHHDSDMSNWYLQASGRKRVWLFAPEQAAHLHLSAERRCPVVLDDAADVARFAGAAEARGVAVTLGPGDALYIPPRTVHYFVALEESVAFNGFGTVISSADDIHTPRTSRAQKLVEEGGEDGEGVRLVFVKVPKTGSTTLANAVYSACRATAIAPAAPVLPAVVAPNGRDQMFRTFFAPGELYGCVARHMSFDAATRARVDAHIPVPRGYVALVRAPLARELSVFGATAARWPRLATGEALELFTGLKGRRARLDATGRLAELVARGELAAEDAGAVPPSFAGVAAARFWWGALQHEWFDATPAAALATLDRLGFTVCVTEDLDGCLLLLRARHGLPAARTFVPDYRRSGSAARREERAALAEAYPAALARLNATLAPDWTFYAGAVARARAQLAEAGLGPAAVAAFGAARRGMAERCEAPDLARYTLWGKEGDPAWACAEAYHRELADPALWASAQTQPGTTAADPTPIQREPPQGQAAVAALEAWGAAALAQWLADAGLGGVGAAALAAGVDGATAKHMLREDWLALGATGLQVYYNRSHSIWRFSSGSSCSSCPHPARSAPLACRRPVSSGASRPSSRARRRRLNKQHNNRIVYTCGC